MARTEQISLFLFFCVLVCCPQLITSVEGEGGSTNVCLMSPSEVNRTLVERFGSTAIVNCLAYNAQRELERAVVSVANDGRRYDLTCEGGILTAMILNNVQVGTTNQNQLTCLECDFNVQQLAEVCLQRCNTTCEGCHSNDISMCSDCTRYRRLRDYPVQEEFDAEECNLGSPMDLLNDFVCVDNCGIVGETYQPSEEISDTCFACGLEYCVTCNPEEGAHGECIACLEHTVLFEGECHAPPSSRIACQAIVQEEEEADELAQIRRRQLELAIALPVVCFLIIVFFVGMSIFAHYQYPHIGQAGDKRHRKKQELETSMTEGDPNEPPLEATIWRSRPTIRYR